MSNRGPVSSRDKTPQHGTHLETSEWVPLVGRYGFNQAAPSNPDGVVELIRLNTWSK